MRNSKVDTEKTTQTIWTVLSTQEQEAVKGGVIGSGKGGKSERQF